MHDQAESEQQENMPSFEPDRRIFLKSTALGVAGSLAGVAPLVRAQDQAPNTGAWLRWRSYLPGLSSPRRQSAARELC